MKALHIDFIDQPHWRIVWLLTAVVSLALLFFYLPSSSRLYTETHQIAQNIASVSARLGVSVPVATPVNDLRAQHKLQISAFMQQDLNKVFSLVEAIKEPNSRLKSMSFDHAMGKVRLEYDIDSVPRATSLTLALNAGYITPPWQFESVNTIQSQLVPAQSISAQLPIPLQIPSLGGSAPPTISAVNTYRAIWTARLDKL
jgi:hypothetical protein